MKLNKKSFFNFDHVMLIDGNQKFSEDKLKLLNNNKGEKFLGATFNHRLFNLSQKSTIKSELEYLNINHLMFSIRPSFKKIFLKKFNLSSKFKIIFSALDLFLTDQTTEVSVLEIGKKARGPSFKKNCLAEWLSVFLC